MVRLLPVFLFSLSIILSCGVKVDHQITQHEIEVIKISKSNSNVYLLKKDKYAILIDAGYAKDSLSIENAILEQGVKPHYLQYIILTHAHSDHTGVAAFFKKKYGCKIIGGGPDRFAFESGQQEDLCPTSLFARLLKMGVKPDFPRVKVDLAVETDAPLNLTYWGMEIECLPGHTPGSLIIHTDIGLFVGDLIRGGFSNHTKPKRHYFMCDIDDNNQDIKDLLDRSDIKTWYPGHFGPLESDDVMEWVKCQ